MKLNIPLLVITVVLGLAVLASYIPMIMDIRKNNNSKLYWGLDKQQRIPYYVFMIFPKVINLIKKMLFLGKSKKRQNFDFLKKCVNFINFSLFSHFFSFFLSFFKKSKF